MDTGAKISLWDASAAEEDYLSEMDGDITTELAIVGGGFTGLSTALHAAEKGVEAHVLEARKIGYGGSGRNVGLVNAGLWLPPQDVRDQLGDARGSAFIKLLGDAPEYVFSLIEKHQIRCEATRNGTIHAAHSPKGFDDLARRAEEWHRLGAPVDLLTKEQAADKIGTEKFHGGLLDHRAGTINPMGYVRGLARAARGAGASISTGVTVQGLKRHDDRWMLKTTRGTVHAKHVVLGTNAYSDDLWPGLKDTFTMIHYFQLATEALGDRAAHILKERQGLWDTGSIMFSLRRDAFGRIAIGSMGTVVGGMSGLSKRWASRMLRRLFPELGTVKFETAWHGQIAMTPDHLPRIHRLAEGLYTPIGYNGRGITPGTMFGKAMAGLLTGDREENLPLPVTDLKVVPNRKVMSRLYQTAFTMNQLIKSV
ncbi:MAG: NAD(P)/FAD-dependent oxidoreductase [Hyphomicrobiaceae bacterium]